MKAISCIISISACSLFALVASARAEQLKFQCSDQDGPYPVIVDTKTGSSMSGEPTLLPGTATTTAGSITITMTDGYHFQMNRKTGAFTDSDGMAGRCRPTK
jgi:hypothetical protein